MHTQKMEFMLAQFYRHSLGGVVSTPAEFCRWVRRVFCGHDATDAELLAFAVGVFMRMIFLQRHAAGCEAGGDERGAVRSLDVDD